MLGNTLVTEQLSASQERLSSMEYEAVGCSETSAIIYQTTTINLHSLFRKNKVGLWDHVAVCVCVYTLIVTRQRLGKYPPVVRQRLGRNVTAVTNTHATIEELLDASCQGKQAISSSQNFLFSIIRRYIVQLLKASLNNPPKRSGPLDLRNLRLQAFIKRTSKFKKIFFAKSERVNSMRNNSQSRPAQKSAPCFIILFSYICNFSSSSALRDRTPQFHIWLPWQWTNRPSVMTTVSRKPVP
jgi:hypothetical protein